jgi:hypothetical protein
VYVPRLPSRGYPAHAHQLAYTLVFLQNGTLPWDESGGVGTTSADALCAGLDPVFAELVRWARGLVQGEDPQHARLRARLVEAWVNAGFGDALGHVDWWSEYESLAQARKAEKRAARLPYTVPLPPSPPPEHALQDAVTEARDGMAEAAVSASIGLVNDSDLH